MASEAPEQIIQLYLGIDRLNVQLTQQAERDKAKFDAVYRELVNRPEVRKAIDDSINELEQVINSLENSMPNELDALRQLVEGFQQAANDFFVDPNRKNALTFFQTCNQKVNNSVVINSNAYPELERIFCRILLAIREVLASVGISFSPPDSLFYHAKKEIEFNVKTDEFLATVKRLSPA
jgi:hypothetical protein